MNPQEEGSSSSSSSKSFRQHEWRHEPPLLSSATLYCTAFSKRNTASREGYRRYVKNKEVILASIQMPNRILSTST